MNRLHNQLEKFSRRNKMKNGLHMALPEDIREWKTTDIYFMNAKKVLMEYGKENLRVVAEFTASSLPPGWEWGVFCGLDEVVSLLKGLPIDLYALPEGTVFKCHDPTDAKIPVMVIEGKYGDFILTETPVLGLICQASGIATKASRIKFLVRDKQLLSFGIRRMHPAICPMIDRSAYIGGCDAVSSILGAEEIGKKPQGTMPHSLIICFGDQKEAWTAFDTVMPPDVPRIALIDTYWDEKTEAIQAAGTLGERLDGIRLDTPSSRKGNLAEIVREVRWELDLRGWRNVKIAVSGGITEENIEELVRAGVDAFGVGTSISSAKSIDYSMDIVELEGKPCAKRGKLGGRKMVYRCDSCDEIFVHPADHKVKKCSFCGGALKPILVKYLDQGKVVREMPSAEKVRDYCISQIRKMKKGQG
jgi:nicotinate phosphoribosyltransferase